MRGLSGDQEEDMAFHDAVLHVLDDILAEVKLLNARLGQTAQQAKVEIKTSTRGSDVTVVAYEDTTPDELAQAGNTAVREYRRVMQQLSNEVMDTFYAEANRHGSGS